MYETAQRRGWRSMKMHRDCDVLGTQHLVRVDKWPRVEQTRSLAAGNDL
jgi:hypothetical protein